MHVSNKNVFTEHLFYFSDFVNDFGFSPFDDSVLATCSKDCLVGDIMVLK